MNEESKRKSTLEGKMFQTLMMCWLQKNVRVVVQLKFLGAFFVWS